LNKVFDLIIEKGRTYCQRKALMAGINISISEKFYTTSRNRMMMREDAFLSALGNLELDAK
jgi:hypothetical protein